MTVSTTSTFGNLTINNIENLSFIGGQQMELTFPVADELGAPVDLASSVCTWTMSPYGNPNYVSLALIGVASGSPNENEFVVTISGSSTENLSGKFIQQPKVVDFSGKTHLPGQGTIQIIPQIR